MLPFVLCKEFITSWPQKKSHVLCFLFCSFVTDIKSNNCEVIGISIPNKKKVIRFSFCQNRATLTCRAIIYASS